MHQASIVAATTLALTMFVAAIATIHQVDTGATHCATAPCSAEAQARTAPSNTTWEASLHRALVRTERGFLQMAGMAAAR